MGEIFVVAFIWIFLAQIFGGASQFASSSNYSDDESPSSAFDDEDDDFWRHRHQSHEDASDSFHSINPTSGLPMIDGIGGIDIAGNPYGTDSSHWDDYSMSGSSTMDDSFTSSSSSFDDTFSSSSFDDSFSSSSYSSFDD